MYYNTENLMLCNFIFVFQSFQVRNFTKSSAALSDSLFVHRDTPENNAEIKFEFTKENVEVCPVFASVDQLKIIIPYFQIESKCNHEHLS